MTRTGIVLAALLCTLLPVGGAWVAAAADVEPMAPPVDADGHFWVYGEVANDNGSFVARPETAVASGWMPGEVMSILDEEQTSIKCTEQPHAGNVCWRVVVKNWVDPYWCGIAWFTKDGAKDKKFEPDEAWPSYDLSRAKKLVFWAKGAEGDEVFQVKIGILYDKGPYGDQSRFPIASKWLKATAEWKRYEVPLTDYSSRLKRIVNPFCLILSRDTQGDNRNGMTLFLDDIYYEIAPAEK